MGAEKPHFLKGYKLDLQKIRKTFPQEAEDPTTNYELSWSKAILDSIGRESYQFVGCGVEPDGHLNLVWVIEEGDDEIELKKTPVETSDADLAEAAKFVLTPGVWPSK